MKRNTPAPKQVNINLKQHMREGLFILACAVSLYLLIALFTYHRSDVLGVMHTANRGGRAGAWLAEILFDLLGYLAYLLPVSLTYLGWVGFRDRHEVSPELKIKILRGSGFSLFFIGACGLAGLHSSSLELAYGAGGLLGFGIAKMLTAMFNFAGASLLLLALLLCGITLGTGLSWFEQMDKTGRLTLILIDKIGQFTLFIWDKLNQLISNQRGRFSESSDEDEEKPPRPANIEFKKMGKRSLARVEPEIHRQEPAKPKPAQLPLALRTSSVSGVLPSLDLLDPAEKPTGKGYSNEDLERLSRDVELRLQDFGIVVQVVAVHPGPVVTRFEMELAAGIKVSRITTLAKDLARSLSAVSVRIVEVIPGKSVVGLELPNKQRDIVHLSEVLSSQQYEQARSPLSLALGKDIAGHPVVVDLAKMPHLLVAGTTGSGKSVGLNGMLLSLLFKATADQVRLIMIDPKMLELSIYEGIPHLLAPVVTDMKEAANALRWCVAEMDRRYRLMATMGVRNLAGFNQKIQEAEKAGEPIRDPFWKAEEGGEASPLTSLPYIVVLVDEFADMMMVVGKKVEELIARIAQKARAAGIHLILATQRPSVDVITGLIKANIPTRIAFQVSSKIDSRTILDQQGAEQLLGYGDMLYLPPGTGVPVRVHGAYVADHEVHNVVHDLRQRGTPEYVMSIVEDSNETGNDAIGNDEAEQDPLYDQAVQIVIENRRASISLIQRRLKIGYNRAARLVEDMEKAGLVGPMESNGNREILIPETV